MSESESEQLVRKLRMDSNEPTALFAAVGQTRTPFNIEPLNAHGHSDYMWTRVDDVEKEVERKTWGEILADTNRVEEQLFRHLTENPLAEHVLLLEGMAVATARGSVILKPTKSGVWVKGHEYRTRLTGIYAWLYQISHYVTIIPTSHLEQSALALVAMFESDGKAEHKTLHRHIAQTTFNPDPVVKLLMSIYDGVGEARALEIRKVFPTIYSVVTARPADWMRVNGVGAKLAHEFCRRVGSPYVD